MADLGFQLQDESEHLLAFSQETNADSRTPRVVRLTLVDLSESIRVLFDRQVPQKVVKLLTAIQTDAQVISIQLMSAALCNKSYEDAQDRVHKMGQSLSQLGCSVSEPPTSDACKTYWKRYRENVAKEQESLKSSVCSFRPLSSLPEPQASK